LISPENTLAALDELNVDIVAMSNNHIRDYMEDGVAQTLDALDAAALPHVGAGITQSQAEAPRYITIAGMKVGMLAFTTVDGDFVNDSYPTDQDTEPASLDYANQWMWEFRTWGFTGHGIDIPTQDRRIGSVWELFEDYESDEAPDAVAALWASIVAAYPEMQDWVSRRGHGGASPWAYDDSIAAIELAADESDFLVVQFHSGFQFMPAPSGNVMANTRAAIDAGANIVIAHHPHVLQGIHWYKGRPIVYSLGNFIFDQDFFATYSTLVLRTIWDGAELLETRLLPMQIDGYRPVFVTDQAADFVLDDVWRKSLLGAKCERGEGNLVFVELTEPDAFTQPANFLYDRNSAIVSDLPLESYQHTYDLEPKSVIDLPPCTGFSRTLSADPAEDILVGVDILGWGHFEDVDTDADEKELTHWSFEESNYKQIATKGCYSGEACIQMRRSSTNDASLFLRTTARLPLYDHRFYTVSDDVHLPADSAASYSVRIFAKATGVNQAYVRLSLYHFDDLDPTIAPESALVRDLDMPLNMPADGKWHAIVLDVPASALVPEDPDAPINFVLPYIYFPPTEVGESTVWLDDFAIIEWRKAADQPVGYSVYDFLRNDSDQTAATEINMVYACAQAY
jgi:poly-gamma-glutamate capsule biosynthesis protein CapA/YwtB (metallophosphatase superfamily)